MKNILLILALSFTTIAASGQGEGWDVYMAQYEKGPGSVVINMLLKSKAPVKAFPYVVITGVTTTDCSTEGLPQKKAFDQMYIVSDSVINLVNKLYENIHAGTFTYQCERLDYIYVKDTAGIRDQLTRLYTTRFPGFKYYINMRPDNNWETYLTFLYPSEEIQEYMSNQKVVMKLTGAGDKLEKARKVDHWFYCKNEDDRQKLIDYALKNNFTIEQKQFLKDNKLPYQLQISRTDKVDMHTISGITILLRKEAKKYNAEYDGWETLVIKD